MEIKSSEQIANATEIALKTKCNGIGKKSVSLTSSSNIAGVYKAADVFSEVNKTHISYKLCLDMDGLKIKEIGRVFADADKKISDSYMK